ncbi:Imm43 family immunity protein [Acinetobacter johnsonii]|uniref:Imm43 family immunity protein n=1 Tax=Acinetobacter johnsonii TaxID=40214 RepID=UPI00398546CE
MNYFVLSATQSEVCPISLIEDSILYMNKEQVSSDFEHGSLPWYNYKTSNNCELPKEGVFVLKNKNTKISFRNINKNIYIVSECFKRILQNYISTDFLKVEVVDEKLEIIDENEYFIFRFNNLLNYIDVIDINKSNYQLNEDYLILEKAYLLDSLKENIFKIYDMDSAQDTFFISETVKNEIEKVECNGIRIDDVSTAKWRNSDDFTVMFLEENEVNEYVWPI